MIHNVDLPGGKGGKGGGERSLYEKACPQSVSLCLREGISNTEVHLAHWENNSSKGDGIRIRQLDRRVVASRHDEWYFYMGV